MTAAIKSSLTTLNEALYKLEKFASEMQNNQKVAPKAGHDLFSVPATASNDVDATALASRLDGAIAKVEKLLREGDESHG